MMVSASMIAVSILTASAGAIDSLLIAFLVVWLALTLIAQAEPWPPAMLLRRFDLFGMLPAWTLFAPRPSVSDYHVLWRAISSTGEPIGRWTELRMARRNLWLGGLWNPKRRDYKALLDIVSWLNIEMKRDPACDASTRVPYRLLLNHVARRVPPHVERFQFQVLKLSRRTETTAPERLVMSRVHHVRETP